MIEPNKSPNKIFNRRLPRIGLFLGTLLAALLLIPLIEFLTCPNYLAIYPNGADYLREVVWMAMQGFAFLIVYLFGIRDENSVSLLLWIGGLLYLTIAVFGVLVESSRVFRRLYITFIILLCLNILPALVLVLSLASHISYSC